MNITGIIAEELHIKQWQADAAAELLDDGCTVPFIARYRKEKTGSMNDEQLRAFWERLNYLRNLEDRKKLVLSTIEEQGQLTDELRKKIENTIVLVELEDLYRPFKPKRKTRASAAREKGLEGLAAVLMLQRGRTDPDKEAEAYLSEEKGVPDIKTALQGAMDIIAEDLADRADLRSYIRSITWKEGVIVSTAKDAGQSSVYETYYDYEEKADRMPGYRILALNRGEKEKYLTVTLRVPRDEILSELNKRVITGRDQGVKPLLQEAVADSYDRLIAPSTERQIRSDLTERAQTGAVEVFGKNLRQLLMQPPIQGQTVLGWDPAFRTGCKLAVVDPTGKVLDTAVIYPTAPTSPAKIAEAKRVLTGLIKKYGVTLISLGNGTASRESEQIIAQFLHEIPEKVQYVIVNEAGASVYSASELAAKEFPGFDVGQRSAASIARRLQDPLSELVKIDPASIGVGQYQHDMNQKQLRETLGGVVESCVNQVGVDLNTASVPLLMYVSGISRTVAENIVAYRESIGRFKDRRELKKVPKLGPKAFEQCAGFLRIPGGTQPFDNTSVHPESYPAAAGLLSMLGCSPEDVGSAKLSGIKNRVRKDPSLADALGTGKETLEDIAAELEKPGRDPREEMPRPVLRNDVLEMKDLVPGMILKGTVRNVIDFGAFVDIGVHQDGLVHVSKMTDKKFVKHPLEVVSVGDIVTVKVLQVDLQKKRISLSMVL